MANLDVKLQVGVRNELRLILNETPIDMTVYARILSAPIAAWFFGKRRIEKKNPLC
jgi:hypothetical protein